MSAPSTDNAVADFFNNIISALIKGGDVAAEAYITTLDPAILALPPVALLVDQGVQYLGQIVNAYVAKGLTSIVIDVQTKGEESSCLQAALALQEAINKGDQDAINQAVQNASNAYGSLIHWNGSSSNIPS
jgi:hypothetical protein